jgi:hypothetical protein
MSNNYYTNDGYPLDNSKGFARDMRTELKRIEEGFDKLPSTFTPNSLVTIDPSGTRLTISTIKNSELVTKNTTLIAGDGLIAGGNLSANITVTLGTPETITTNTVNQVTANSHTHEISDGAGSGLDGDLLDGQHGEFYRNAGNLNEGTVPNARVVGEYSLITNLYVDKVVANTSVNTATINVNSANIQDISVTSGNVSLIHSNTEFSNITNANIETIKVNSGNVTLTHSNTEFSNITNATIETIKVNSGNVALIHSNTQFSNISNATIETIEVNSGNVTLTHSNTQFSNISNATIETIKVNSGNVTLTHSNTEFSNITNATIESLTANTINVYQTTSEIQHIANQFVDNINANTAEIINITSNNVTTNTGIFTENIKIPVGNTSQRPSAVQGVIRYNTELNSFEGYSGSSWGSLGGGATGGAADKVFIENSMEVTANYTLTAGKSAMSTGPITVQDGVTVTIPSGARWVVI